SDNGNNGNRSMGYYDETDIPFYYGLARAFASSDHHFCSVLGPTYPNRMFYFAGTSYGLAYNNFAPTQLPDGSTPKNIFTELSAAGISWKMYAEDLPSSFLVNVSLATNPDNYPGVTQFFADAKAGTLPQVSFVEGSDSGSGTITVDGEQITAVDEHPAQNLQLGQNFVAHIVNALIASPDWPNSAMFLTYDEHGGEYDHVAPPAACKPDSLPLKLGGGDKIPGEFDRYGFRTPLFVVSPYAKRGYVSHEVVDHTSITRFVETRFNLPALTARDANAWPLLDMFDFSHVNTTVPTLPEAVIDPAQQAQCANPDGGYPPGKAGF
ncbi:MAG: Acid phosphatase, partial [Acidimicrobiaceae bacterium]|nr:Acid phosphatase [Acidimicrobiaceae bacterium]